MSHVHSSRGFQGLLASLDRLRLGEFQALRYIFIEIYLIYHDNPIYLISYNNQQHISTLTNINWKKQMTQRPLGEEMALQPIHLDLMGSESEPAQQQSSTETTMVVNIPRDGGYGWVVVFACFVQTFWVNEWAGSWGSTSQPSPTDQYAQRSNEHTFLCWVAGVVSYCCFGAFLYLAGQCDRCTA